MRLRELCAATACAIVAAACGSAEPQWTGTITDSAGVQIASNTRQEIWTDETRWRLEEELRIGSIEEEPEYQFGRIGSISSGSDGTIYVLDIQGQHVKAFSADGTYLRTIGGPGSGPGELGQANQFQPALMVGPGDTLIVPDMANQRVNRYAPDGTSLGSFQVSFQQGFPLAWLGTRSGTIAMQIRPLGQSGDADGRDHILLLTTDGTVTDTVMSFPSGKSFGFSGGTPEWNVFSPEPVWTLTDDRRVVTGVQDAYRLSVYAPTGALEQIITMPFELRPVSERDKSVILGLFEEAFEQSGVPATFAQRLLQNVSFAEFLPAFAGIQLGPGNSIWVQHLRATSELDDEQPDLTNFIEEIGSPNWDVIDRSGRFLGVVTMPNRFAPRTVDGDKIYGVWRDELDVQYVMRLKIIGADID